MPDGMRKDCKVCNTAQARDYYHRTKEHRAELYRQRVAEWRDRPGNAQKNRENALAWYKDPVNMEVAKQRAMEWKAAHPERKKQNDRSWRDANPGKRRAFVKAYKIRKIMALPVWANEFFISEAYDLAVRRTVVTGIAWHVDHVLPLRGKKVSGLHVENNLAVIHGRVNLSKGNKYSLD